MGPTAITPVPAIPPALPVRMHIAITRTYRLPVATDADIARAIPTPVTACPYITRSKRGFHFHDTLRWWLRGDDFDVLALLHRRTLNHHASLMDHSLFHAPGSHCDHRYHRHVTQKHAASSTRYLVME
jgi:hypothetical protein